MGLSLKLVQKLVKRSRKIKENERGKYDRENKLELVMNKSPRSFKLARKVQRRLDKSMGNDQLGHKPLLAKQIKVATLDRHDYGVSDFGMRLTLASGLEAAVGLQPNDVIKVLSGNAKGHELLVVSLTDSTHVRLEDLASYAYPGTVEITSVTAVDDVAGSLNSTYFNFSDAADAHLYYVWFDNGTGVDPAPAGRTGIHVVYTNNATASTLGGLVRAAITSAAGTHVSVSGSGANIVITNLLVGTTTDAANGTASPGFTISVTQQGTNANASPSESNIQVLALLSTQKAQFNQQSGV